MTYSTFSIHPKWLLDYAKIDLQTLLKRTSLSAFELMSKQIEELVKRDLLVVKNHELIMVRMPDSDEVQVKQFFTLELHNQQYVEKIEKENAELKEKLKRIEDAMADLNNGN